ncbi:hypothetical protein LINGRAHAP2_LOCUS8501 [Linum grandiflorum]
MHCPRSSNLVSMPFRSSPRRRWKCPPPRSEPSSSRYLLISASFFQLNSIDGNT